MCVKDNLYQSIDRKDRFVKAAERQKLKHDKYAETVVSGLQWAKVHQSKVIAVAAAVVIVASAVVWVIHSRIQAQPDAGPSSTNAEATRNAPRMKGETQVKR